MPGLTKTEEILLVEYQKSQDSAEHYDNLIWTMFTVVFAAVGVLISIAHNTASSQSVKVQALVSALVVLFISLGFVVIHVRLKDVKYRRCKEIEQKLGMTQHRSTDGINGFVNGRGLLLVGFAFVALMIIIQFLT